MVVFDERRRKGREGYKVWVSVFILHSQGYGQRDMELKGLRRGHEGLKGLQLEKGVGDL